MNTVPTSKTRVNAPCLPDSRGFYGDFGGAYIPEMLFDNIESLRQNYLEILHTESFQKDFQALLCDYVGRPTPLYLAANLSRILGARIYLKREDLCHTGAHKLNNVVGQALLARIMGKKHIIAETGAGQHGVAIATVCAMLKLPCTIFMGSKDMARQHPNVMRMKMLGAEVVSVHAGSQTLKDATSEAIRYWIAHPQDTHYLIGSAIGPHPYPDMVARLQAIISQEIIQQLHTKEGRSAPDYVVACAGGGSNAAGAFFHFIGNGTTRLIGAEAAGDGLHTQAHAASISLGTPGIIHGCKTLLLQNGHGQIQEAHSISAGLDYPGIGPMHAHLHQTGLARYLAVTDQQALQAACLLSQQEGIIPALESAHALAALHQLTFQESDIVVVSLSGRGDKDLQTYQQHLPS